MTCCALIQMAILDSQVKYAYAPVSVSSIGYIFRINLQPGCSSASLAAAFPLTGGAILGTCPPSGMVPFGYTCQLSCQVGYIPGSGGSLTCGADTGGWSGTSQQCAPPSCNLPALPTGTTAGTCTSGSILEGNSCTYGMTLGRALTFGSLTITCLNFGLTQGPTTSVSSCAGATLPVGTATGRCDASYCYLNPLPGWTLSANSLKVTCRLV
jgi:hypothetical protein